MKWISVKDQLPEAERDVLFVAHFDGKPEICFGYKFNDDPENARWLDKLTVDYDGNYEDVSGVTYWMPLPDLP